MKLWLEAAFSGTGQQLGLSGSVSRRPKNDPQKVVKPVLFFCLLLFQGTFTSFLKNKKLQRSHKTVGIKGFFFFLLDDRRIQIRISD